MTEMDNSLKVSADILATKVAELGGYLSYDAIDRAAESMFMPYMSLAGWGSPFNMQHNTTVIVAQAACELGLLHNTGEGYQANNLENKK